MLMAYAEPRLPMKAPKNVSPTIQIRSEAVKDVAEEKELLTDETDGHSDTRRLIAGFKQANPESFRRLRLETEERLTKRLKFKFNALNDAALEDFAQDVFLKAWENCKSFQGEDIENFNAWVTKIAVNAIYTSHKKKANQQTITLDDLQEAPSTTWDGRDLPESISLAITFGTLKELISRLPSRQAQLMSLVGLREPPMDLKDAADEMGIGFLYAQVLQSRARRSLKEMLRRKSGPGGNHE